MTHKQERFVDEYLLDFNATQAAIRAGYNPHSAASIGEENLKKPDIQIAIHDRQATIKQQLDVEQEDVLGELIRIGFANIDDFLSWDSHGQVSFLNFDDIPYDTKAAVKSYKNRVRYDKNGNRVETIELVLHDKLLALDKLFRYLIPFTKYAAESRRPFSRSAEKEDTEVDSPISEAVLEEVNEAIRQALVKVDNAKKTPA